MFPLAAGGGRAVPAVSPMRFPAAGHDFSQTFARMFSPDVARTFARVFGHNPPVASAAHTPARGSARRTPGRTGSGGAAAATGRTSSSTRGGISHIRHHGAPRRNTLRSGH